MGTEGKFIREKVRSVDAFVTKTMVPHGSYGMYSRHDIKQHDYMAGQDEDSGNYRFIEVLEVRDAPDERCGIVIYDKSSYQGSSFSEWSSLEEAKQAFQRVWGCRPKKRLFENDPEPDTWEPIRSLPGFKRVVNCGAMSPWFYAIGEQQLVGDYAFPDGLQDDPVFIFGARFVVFDREEKAHLKTCMGTRFIEDARRLVYWHDGTCWDDFESRVKPPVPARDGDIRRILLGDKP